MTGLLLNSCPVNWSHALNRSLVAWWADPPQPGWSGGLTLRDLVGLSKRQPGHGTRNGGVGAAWNPQAGRLLVFDGTNDYVSTDSAALKLTGELTLAFWLRFAGTYSGGARVIASNLQSGGANCSYQLEFGRTANKFTWIQNGSTVDATFDAVISDDLLRHHVFVRRGSTGSWTLDHYINGVLSSSKTTTANSTASPGLLSLGRAGEFNGNYLLGALGDFRLYSRPLGAGEAQALYQQARRGHPDTLNWAMPPQFWDLNAGAATVFNPYYYRLLNQAGAL